MRQVGVPQGGTQPPWAVEDPQGDTDLQDGEGPGIQGGGGVSSAGTHTGGGLCPPPHLSQLGQKARFSHRTLDPSSPSLSPPLQ